MPVGYPRATIRPPEWDDISRGLSEAGLIIKWAELAAAFSLIDGTGGESLLSGIDLAASGFSCYYGGQCGWTRTPIHPSLPRMFIIGQDFLVTSADFTLPFIALGVGTLATGNPIIGGAAQVCTDIITTGASIIYDSGRLNGSIQYRATVGISAELKAYLILYPDQNELSIE